MKRNLGITFGVATNVIVPAILSIVLAVLGVGVFAGTIRNMRRDPWSMRGRDRFFGRWFRWFWLVAGVISSVLLLNAAWLVWVAPLKALMFVLLVPIVAGTLVGSARKVLPWLYDRHLRR